MLILGLDPSLTNFGWALHDTDATGAERCLDRGRFRTKPRQFPDEIRRYKYLRQCLFDKIEELQPDAMGIESPVFKEDYSEGMYALFMFSLEAIQDSAQDVVFFSPPQVKSWAKEVLDRPRGWKMHKSDMVEAAKDLTGGKGRWDHNEADAFHVAALSGRFWKLFTEEIDEDDLTTVEKRTFTKIHTFTRGKRKGQTVMKGILHRQSERFFLWSIE